MAINSAASSGLTGSSAPFAPAFAKNAGHITRFGRIFPSRSFVKTGSRIYGASVAQSALP